MNVDYNLNPGKRETKNFKKVVSMFKEYHEDVSLNNFPHAFFHFGDYTVSLITEKYYGGTNDLEYALKHKGQLDVYRFQTLDETIEFIKSIKCKHEKEK